MTMRKVIVTGGGGYIGGYLCNFLAKKGYKVISIDVDRQKYLEDHPNISFVKADVRDSKKIAHLFKGLDAVFHLAFVQTDSCKLPMKLLRDIDIEGTRSILDLAFFSKARKFVFASSSEVYGTNPPNPITEESPTPLTDPLNKYSLLKIEAENLAWQYYRERGLPVTSLRFPMVCGEGFYNYKVLMRLVRNLRNGLPYLVVGNGRSKFRQVYINDVVEGHYLAYLKKESIGKSFNICADGETSIIEMISILKQKYHSKALQISIPLYTAQFFVKLLQKFGFYIIHPGDLEWMTKDILFDNSKAKKILGFRPTKTTRECVEILVDSFINNFSAVITRDTDRAFINS
jgi:nucleoside-diphosphate-sugar epimerase